MVSIPTPSIPLATSDARHNTLHVVWGVVFLDVLLPSRSYVRSAWLIRSSACSAPLWGLQASCSMTHSACSWARGKMPFTSLSG